MKKTIAFLLATTLFSLLLFGCSRSSDPFEVTSHDAATESELDEQEIKKITAISDAAVRDHFGIDDLSDYSARIVKSKDGEINVVYKLYISDISTRESYTVYINTDGEVKDIFGEYGEYAKYLPKASERKIKKAKKNIEKDIKEYGDNTPHYYFTIDNDGYLCLGAEIIIPIDPPADTGCMDHDHRMFSERICPAP